VGVGLVYVPAVGAVQPWFTSNRALASGIAVAGIGAGNFAVPPLVAHWIEVYGWRGAFAALALFVLVLGGAAAAAIDVPPKTGGAPREGMTLGAALRTPQFALLYVSLAAGCVGVFVPTVHLGPFAQDHGYSEAEGVALVSLIGLGSLLGRFLIGPFADRIGRRASLAAMYAALGVLLLVWWGASAYWLLGLFAFFFGVFYGGCVALLPTIVMDLYGARAVSGIIGFLYTGAGLGTLLGPWLAGAAFDAFGSYGVPIVASAILSFVAAAFVLPLVKSEKAPLVHRG
jgi:predicted MFS family arabinose efflux permease